MKHVLIKSMQLRFQEFDDFIIFFKPYGIRMHQVDDGQFGFVEALAYQLKQPLFIVHRLDKETSGLVILAKSATSAALLTELFQNHLITKTYFFLTDHTVSKTQFVVKTYIDKSKFASTNHSATNSETTFTYVHKVENLHLWKATPKTDKPHQIRLHAQNAGIPIYGDKEHGGSKSFRLCLQASEIEFTVHKKLYHFKISLPPSFIGPAHEQIKNLFIDSLFNKNELFHLNKNSCYRLIHTEGLNTRADIYGNHLWVYDYSERGLSTAETESIQQFANDNHLSSSIRHMIDRGAGVGGLEKSTLQTKATTNDIANNIAPVWQASEENMQFQLRTDSGFSPGLFLDQKENRKFVLKESFDKTVLNLFSYTAGFSVAAAKGEAKTVTTVDVSKKFLEWSKENFKLNHLDPAAFEFFAQDCLLFLKGSKKRNRTWDLIICDPPSFGRSENSVWKIEKNLSELAELIYTCLSLQGQILFTCNYEKWSRSQLIQEFTKKLPKNKFKIERLPFLSLDFNETDDEKNLMKGFLLKRID